MFNPAIRLERFITEDDDKYMKNMFYQVNSEIRCGRVVMMHGSLCIPKDERSLQQVEMVKQAMKERLKLCILDRWLSGISSITIFESDFRNFCPGNKPDIYSQLYSYVKRLDMDERPSLIILIEDDSYKDPEYMKTYLEMLKTGNNFIILCDNPIEKIINAMGDNIKVIEIHDQPIRDL